MWHELNSCSPQLNGISATRDDTQFCGEKNFLLIDYHNNSQYFTQNIYECNQNMCRTLTHNKQ